jgi:hypothetical protein
MRAGNLLLALFFIVAGVVIFLSNLGYASPDLLRQLFRFWPLILIIVGISLFWGGIIPRFIAVLLVIVLAVGVVILAFVIPGPGPQAGVQTDLRVEQGRYPGLETGRLTLQFGGGRLFVDGQTDHWFDGKFRGSSQTAPSFNVEQQRLVLNIRERHVSLPRRNIINIWQLHLSPNLDWDLDVESGAVDGDLDLHGIPLNNVNLKVGAGNMTVRLGENGENVQMRVEAGAANLKILVPEDTGLDIRMNGVLANTNLRELGWPQVNGRYRSPLYDRATSHVKLDIDVAVGNFTVEVLPVQR